MHISYKLVKQAVSHFVVLDLELDHAHVDRFGDDAEVVWVFLLRGKRQKDVDESPSFQLQHKPRFKHEIALMFTSFCPDLEVVNRLKDRPQPRPQLLFRRQFLALPLGSSLV